MLQTQTMRRPALYLFPIMLLLLLVGVILMAGQTTPSVRAQSTTIAATQDTYVNFQSPATNYDGTKLLLSYSNNVNNEFVVTKRALIQFDLTGVTTPLDSATLKLSILVNSVKNGNATVTIYSTSDSWTEGAVTDATAPSQGSSLGTATVAQM